VNKVILEMKERWKGSQYEVLTKNCNHFCQEFAKKLGVNSIPGEMIAPKPMFAGGMGWVSSIHVYAVQQRFVLQKVLVSSDETSNLVVQQQSWKHAVKSLKPRLQAVRGEEPHSGLQVSNEVCFAGWVNRMASTADAVTTFGAQTAEQVPSPLHSLPHSKWKF